MATKLEEQIKDIDATDESSNNTITIEDDEIVSHIKQLRQKAVQYQNDRSTRRQKWYKEYRAEPYGNEREGYSKAVKSVIWDVVQGSMPGLLEIFTGDFFTLKSDSAVNAEKLQKLIKYQMLVKNNGEEELDGFIHNCLIYEFGILKTYYKSEYENKTEVIEQEIDQATFDALNQQFTISKYDEKAYKLEDGSKVITYKNVKVIKKELVYSGPIMENISPTEFYISPGEKDVDTAKYVGHWTKRTLDYLKRREAAGIYRKGSLDKVKASLEEKNNGNNTSDFELKEYNDVGNETNYNVESNETYPGRKEALPASEITIKEEYCKLDLDGDGLLENAIVISCNDVVLSVSENPYKRPPFRLGRVFPEPHKVTGTPYPQILESDQKVQTSLVRFLIDATALSTFSNPITDDPRLADALQKREPFDVIRANPNKIEFLQTPVPSQATFSLLEYTQSMVENKTGVTRYNQGLDADSLNKTATGINIITSASQQKQKTMAKRIARTMTQVVRDFIFINQTWPPKNVVNIVGADLQINPEDLRGEFTITPVIGIGPQEKAFSAQQIDNFVGMALKGGLMQLGIADAAKIRAALEYKGKLQDIPYERFMYSEQEMSQGMNVQIPQLQAQLQQAGQQVQGMGGELQKLQDENMKMKQQIMNSSTSPIQLQMKQEELQGEFQLEKYKADLAAQVELKKIEMEIAAREKLEMMKLEYNARIEEMKKMNINTDVIAMERI